MGGRGVALGGGWLFGEEKVARRFVTDRAHLFLRAALELFRRDDRSALRRIRQRIAQAAVLPS